jgi:hypothetical protein
MMTPQQKKRWTVVRARGRNNFVIKKAMLWGIPLAILSTTVQMLLKVSLAHITFYDWNPRLYSYFSPRSEWFTNKLIWTFLFEVGQNCLLAGALALAVWTVKEQRYMKVEKAGETMRSESKEGA